MIRSGLKQRYGQVRRTSEGLGVRFAPLIARKLREAAARGTSPKDELDFLDAFLDLVKKHPPPAQYDISSVVRAQSRELKSDSLNRAG